METSKILDLSGAIKEQNDYYGGNGLLYCGKCQTPKEHIIESNGILKGRKVRIMCKCEHDAYILEAKK